MSWNWRTGVGGRDDWRAAGAALAGTVVTPLPAVVVFSALDATPVIDGPLTATPLPSVVVFVALDATVSSGNRGGLIPAMIAGGL